MTTQAPIKNDWKELLKSILSFVAIALFLRATVVEAFTIPSSSMESTLLIKDHILVNKLAYGLRVNELWFDRESLLLWASPKRGDIVVFSVPDDPETTDVKEDEINLIKRVIGVPGDTVEVRGIEVFINGKLLSPEPYAQWLSGGLKDFPPVYDANGEEIFVTPGSHTVTVPEGSILLLGDNRDRSKDSRFWKNPFVDIHRVKGRAFVVYWNTSDPSRMLTKLR